MYSWWNWGLEVNLPGKWWARPQAQACLTLEPALDHHILHLTALLILVRKMTPVPPSCQALCWMLGLQRWNRHSFSLDSRSCPYFLMFMKEGKKRGIWSQKDSPAKVQGLFDLKSFIQLANKQYVIYIKLSMRQVKRIILQWNEFHNGPGRSAMGIGSTSDFSPCQRGKPFFGFLTHKMEMKITLVLPASPVLSETGTKRLLCKYFGSHKLFITQILVIAAIAWFAYWEVYSHQDS